MAIDLTGDALIPVRQIATESSEPVTNTGYNDVPLRKVLSFTSGFSPAAHQADSVAADVSTLVSDFNALLDKLQTAGLMD